MLKLYFTSTRLAQNATLKIKYSRQKFKIVDNMFNKFK